MCCLDWSSFLAARLLSLALVWCRKFPQQCLVNASKAIKIKIFVVFTYLYSKFLFAKKSVDHVLYYTSRILCKQTNILRQKKFLTSSFFKFLSVLGESRLLSKVSLKRKNTVGDNENKYFHITVKIISRFLLFQDRI